MRRKIVTESNFEALRYYAQVLTIPEFIKKYALNAYTCSLLRKYKSYSAYREHYVIQSSKVQKRRNYAQNVGINEDTYALWRSLAINVTEFEFTILTQKSQVYHSSLRRFDKYEDYEKYFAGKIKKNEKKKVADFESRLERLRN